MLAVPLSAAFNPAADRYPKQGSDTKHVLSKDKMQKELPNYHLFITQTKRPRCRCRGQDAGAPGGGCGGDAAPQAGHGTHGAPTPSVFPLAAAMVSMDFGKKRPLWRSVT